MSKLERILKQNRLNLGKHRNPRDLATTNMNEKINRIPIGS